MVSLYQSANEELLHAKAMQQLANECGHDMQIIRQVYEAELMRLQEGAHIRDYLVLLAARRAREMLTQSLENPPPPSIH